MVNALFFTGKSGNQILLIFYFKKNEKIVVNTVSIILSLVPRIAFGYFRQ